MTEGLAISTGLLVCLYYLSAWWLVGRDPKIGPIVTQYDPPDNLSPAMLRFVWKQTFDDRAFWATVLGLVAKRAIRIVHENDVVLIRANGEIDLRTLHLAREERRFFTALVGEKRSKPVKLNMLTETAYTAVSVLAESLRVQALDRWFQENSRYALIGAALSCIPVLLAAHPDSIDKWVALLIEFAVMVPAAFYGVFLAIRLQDLVKITRGKLLRLPSGAFRLLGFFVPCLMAIVFGFTMLDLTFGPFVFATALAMVALGVIFMHLLKAPTIEGTRLLSEIEGFREFLKSVEKLPMDRDQAPGNDVTRYEKYLPYAVALEVEQLWSDKLVALASATHAHLRDLHATCYYLGIWRGHAIDLVIGPPPSRRGY